MNAQTGGTVLSARARWGGYARGGLRAMCWIGIVLAGSVAAWVAYRIVVPTYCTDHMRVRAQIATLGGKAEAFRKDVGRFPRSLNELTISRGLGPYARTPELIDPWQRPLYYRIEAAGEGFVLFSLGHDGRIGGEDESRDVGYVPYVPSEDGA
ncbi:type II secretion system protein GspG [Lysobacter sp. CA199]|uniref:type II secretion system protein GspG n=1 Tax=Lysobacter sp. CA199 TaxID=3455608 RepID=UPI003F8D6970